MGKFILFVALIAAVVYFLFWTYERRRAVGAGRADPLRPPRPSRPQPPRTIAPDDDPDFLWRLEQERKRREKESGDGS